MGLGPHSSWCLDTSEGGPRWARMLLARAIWGRWSLGLDGFQLIAVDEHDGELELAVETTDDMVGCPGCGAVATAHGRRPVRVRDLPVGGRRTTLIWIKRLWRCRHQRCEMRTWSETSPDVPPRASLTTRAARDRAHRSRRWIQAQDSSSSSRPASSMAGPSRGITISSLSPKVLSVTSSPNTTVESDR